MVQAQQGRDAVVLAAFFAAVRISVPGAITGALLAEWLAVGGGIGGSIGGFIPQAQFTALWASVVVVTATSLILYNVIQIVEDVVLGAWACIRRGRNANRLRRRGLAAVKQSGDVRCVETPGGEAAVIVHRGPYSGLPVAHAAGCIGGAPRISARSERRASRKSMATGETILSDLETTIQYLLR